MENFNRDELLKELQQVEKKELPKRSKEEIKSFVDDLISKMTVEEKVGQLYQVVGARSALNGNEKLLKEFKEGKVGSIINESDNVVIYKLQKIAIEETRLGIPIFVGSDIVHGCYIGQPHNMAMAATWDLDMLKESSRIAAFEASHTGVNVTYAPNLDLVRDPRWGRTNESFGEDPFYGAKYAKATVEGYLEGGETSYDSLSVCLKHFIGYGAATAGRDYNTVDFSKGTLKHYYQPPFQAAIDAGAQGVMTAFNVIDGVSVTANKNILQKLLRDEMKFDGFVLSDYGSPEELLNHKIAGSHEEAAKLAIEAGTDIEMASRMYIENLPKLIEQGVVDEKFVNESVSRVLTFKYKIGLFDNPYKNMYADDHKYFALPEHVEFVRKMSAESVVLYKNDNKALPLQAGIKVALVGDLANTKEVMAFNGFRHNQEDNVSILEGLENNIGKENVKFARGYNIAEFDNIDEKLINEAVALAKESDVVVLALGESKYMSGEARSRARIDFPEPQVHLLKELKATGNKVIVIQQSGRLLTITNIIDHCDALLNAWFLGRETGNALADILFGKHNPGGKLVMSLPYNVGQIPIYYNRLNTGRPNDDNNIYSSRYIDSKSTPHLPFGYGLSYTDFEYTNIDFKEVAEGYEFSYDISNVGEYDGSTVTFAFIECMSFEVSRPINELKGFNKEYLNKGETKSRKLFIKRSDLAYPGIDLEYKIGNGEYKFRLATDAHTILKEYNMVVKK